MRQQKLGAGCVILKSRSPLQPGEARVRSAAAAGMGSALLHASRASTIRLSTRIGDPDPALSTGLWLLTHPELRRSPRVRALLGHMAQELVRMRSVFDPTA
jgi:DNA-binding transcriptional LysR family regulator